MKAAYLARQVNHGQRMGAALAYYTLFSLAPLVLILIAVAGVALGHGPAQAMVLGDIERHFGLASAQAVRELIEQAAKPAESQLASVIGGFALLVGAVGVVGELQSSLNLIWGVPSNPRTFGAFFRTRFAWLAFILAMGFLLLVSLTLNALAAAIGRAWIGWLPFPDILLQVMNMAVSFGILSLSFGVIYKWLPRTRIAWDAVWVGAVATSLLFTLGNYFLGMYLVKIGVASAYGAAGSLVAIVAWAYYCAQILYFGAELTHAYAVIRDQPQGFGGREDPSGHIVPSGDAVLNVVTTLIN